MDYTTQARLKIFIKLDLDQRLLNSRKKAFKKVKQLEDGVKYISNAKYSGFILNGLKNKNIYYNCPDKTHTDSLNPDQVFLLNYWIHHNREGVFHLSGD